MPAKKLVAAFTMPNAAMNVSVAVNAVSPNSSVASSGRTVRSWPIIPPTSALTPTSSENWARFSRSPRAVISSRPSLPAILPRAVLDDLARRGQRIVAGLADWQPTSARGELVILRFGDCELDLARVVLRREGHEVRIEPQVFDLLSLLIERRGAVVRKEELLDQVWGDRFVSESALTTRIKSVRQAVGDDGTRQQVIRTVHGKGYEFVAEVHVVDDPDQAERRASNNGRAEQARLFRLHCSL